jgi:hypothetical protein
MELESALVALGRDLDVPATPDLTTAVLARVEPRPAVRPRRRWAVAVAFAVLAALGATLAIPEARSALLRVLSIGGERIELVDELPPVPTSGDLEIRLGERVSLAEARERAGFDLRELEEPPDRVYLLGTTGTVWFVYGDPGRVRLLVAQTSRLAVDRGLLAKKLVGPDTQVEEVSVEGSQGVFLSGAPHVVLLLDENGNVVEESVRLARNVLVWETNGVAYRLEGDFTKEEALDLADSLR